MLDTRLLQVFDAIHKTRSVSRAAALLGLGQPQVSIALGRLRAHFGDPLFVRVAGGMEPTPLGAELVQPMRAALQALEAALAHRRAFDPATAQQSFRIAMTDISQLVLLPDLWRLLRASAPGVRIEVGHIWPRTPQELEAGDVDLALGFVPQLGAGFYEVTLFEQRHVCLASARHPRIRRSLTLARFEAEEHAVVTTSGTGHRYVERELQRQGIQRRVALHVPNFIGVAFVVESTDLLVTVPERLGEVLAGRARLQAHPVPFELPSYAVKLHWHERQHHDPGHRWLRQCIQDLLVQPGRAPS